tara:strand:+ start:549 stop:830 length:282 start_codon:yes stop_codon:yes gene_type:complete
LGIDQSADLLTDPHHVEMTGNGNEMKSETKTELVARKFAATAAAVADIVVDVATLSDGSECVVVHGAVVGVVVADVVVEVEEIADYDVEGACV